MFWVQNLNFHANYIAQDGAHRGTCIPRLAWRSYRVSTYIQIPSEFCRLPRLWSAACEQKAALPSMVINQTLTNLDDSHFMTCYYFFMTQTSYSVTCYYFFMTQTSYSVTCYYFFMTWSESHFRCFIWTISSHGYSKSNHKIVLQVR